MIGADKPILCAPVPMKRINWHRVAQAVRDGVAPDELEHYTGLFNVVHKAENRGEIVKLNEPFPIERGGSGFMLVKRAVFEQLADNTPDYVSDTPGTAVPPGSRVKHFFPVSIHDDHLMSEDFGLCVQWQKLGGDIWLAPWAEVVHYGTYAFRGTYRACFAAPQGREKP